MADPDRTALRRTAIGFVYQAHHLLPEFTALENVVIPQMIAGLSRREAGDRGRELLTFLGLGQRCDHRPAELSGGEQQRVAIARAVANAPACCWPTSRPAISTPHTADHVFATLTSLIRATGLAALIATHNMNLAARMDRRVTLQDGLVVELD